MDASRPHVGRCALVTGASRGIGAGVARRLAADGADVAINYLGSPELAAEVAADVRRLGRRAVLIRADVGVESDVQRMVAEAETALGGVDILVNNAAFARKASFEQMTTETWLRAFAVNVHGAYWSIKAVVPIMRRRGGGES